ncbi:Uncharacterized conserved protein YbbC, DUF1343 family [Flavobacterium succinicans]|uniref:Uncharacterized conserved protein YbbC, DUF1343 family n=1 Tax=Flavobacterium succinicans TaxID=29536 RepID=A0A1I4XXG2_9FLAO|nr:DUF1343 domain-containing protein [Flavobacterium succinicans]SFN30495.1 Uncharacterized conserved protein YbbC, DUF1343 family [Flavobacterium succinicans]
MKALFIKHIHLALALSMSYIGFSNSIVNKKMPQAHFNTRSIETGADNSMAYLPLLKGKKIGLLTNQTGVLSNQKHLVDFLLEKAISIHTIFAPEHGFRGTADAGEHVKDGKDAKTGIQIVSLYGKNVKPSKEQLQGIEIMVFDLQDVGARFYTYISSLHYLMEACAEQSIPLVVLDRPNPNGGVIDGPILEKNYSSFVGVHPIPMLHGMTIGEYAQMINGEKWLKNGIQCQLTIIPCLNYNHQAKYVLPVKPSPNLPNQQAIHLYASLCLFEGTNVSVGRGTEKQFQIYGSPFLKTTSFSFMPRPNFGAKTPMHNGVLCYGEDLSLVPRPKGIELKWLLKAYKKTKDKSKFFNDFFTKLAGTPQLQFQIEKGASVATIRKSWKHGLDDFQKIRQKYLLY